MSKQTYHQHLQFTFLLTFQFLTPVVIIFIPVVVCGFIILWKIIISEFMIQSGLLGIILYVLTNILLTIGFIGPYRSHFVDSVSGIFKKITFWKSVKVTPQTTLVVQSRL